MKVFIIPCISWVEENNKVLLFLWKLNHNNGRTRESGKYILVSFRSSLSFLSFWALKKNEAICKAKRGWRRSVWWSGMERVYECSYFWWNVLWGVGVVFIVVFLENIIIITHEILWIWGFLLKIICFVSSFSKVITCNLRKI